MFKNCRLSRKSTGFSLVEVMIAVGILSLVVTGVVYFITSGKSTAMKIEGASQCQGLVATILDDFGAGDNRLDVRNFYVAPQSLPDRAPRTPLFEDGKSYNFQNIENTFTRFWQFYRVNSAAHRAICTTEVHVNNGGIDLVQYSSLLTHPSIVTNTGYTIKASFKPYDVSGATNAVCTDLENFTPPNAKNQSYLGLRIQVKVTNTNDPTIVCSGETSAAMIYDTNPPELLTAQIQATAGTLDEPSTVAGTFPSPHVTNTECDNNAVNLSVSSDENGVIFICGTDPADTAINTWVNCAEFKVEPGAEAGVVSATSPQTDPSAAVFQFTSIDVENQYVFYVRAVDTAGNMSAAQVVFFTIDLTRPVWATSVTSDLDAGFPGQKVVDTSRNRPVGSLYGGVNDSHAMPFGAQNYQCQANGTPRFSGTLNTNWGNEYCSASVVSPQPPNERAEFYGTVTAAVCNYAVAPNFVNGDLSLQAYARDVCNRVDPFAGLAGAARTNLDWVLYIETASATHDPQTYTAFAHTGPTFTLDYGLSAALSNQGVVWENKTSTATNQLEIKTGPPGPARRLSRAPADFGVATRSCRYAEGFCAVAWGPCGQKASSQQLAPTAPPASRYAQTGKTGDTCWDTPCNTGLMCDINSTSPNYGTCQARTACGRPWRCTNNIDCGNNACTNVNPWPLNGGICSGVSVGRYCAEDGDCVSQAGTIGSCNNSTGFCECPTEAPIGFYPGPQNNRDPACLNLTNPDGSGLCSGTDPNCTCNLATANTLCPAVTFANSCGVPNACRGRGACLTSSPFELIEIACGSPANWLAKGPQTFPVTADGGALPLTIQCRVPAQSATWRPCTQNDWLESNDRANPWITYEAMAVDTRGDFEVCTGTYKLDRTDPQFNVMPFIDTRAGQPGTSCGSVVDGIPTLGTNVIVTYDTSDNLSATTTTGYNLHTNQASTPCVNPDYLNQTCKLITVDVAGTQAIGREPLMMVTVDAAGNSLTQNLEAFAAPRTYTGSFVSEPPGLPWQVEGLANCVPDCSSAVNLTGFLKHRIYGVVPNTGSLFVHHCWPGPMTDCNYAMITPWASPSTPYNAFDGHLPLSMWSTSGPNYKEYSQYQTPFWGYQGPANVRNLLADSCGNKTPEFVSPLNVDWQPPAINGFVGNALTRTVTFSATDGTGSGIASASISCSDGTSASSPTGTVTVNLPPGTHTCTADAVDNVNSSFVATASNAGGWVCQHFTSLGAACPPPLTYTADFQDCNCGNPANECPGTTWNGTCGQTCSGGTKDCSSLPPPTPPPGGCLGTTCDPGGVNCGAWELAHYTNESTLDNCTRVHWGRLPICAASNFCQGLYKCSRNVHCEVTCAYVCGDCGLTCGGSGGTGCFIAGTSVDTLGGPAPIEDIKVGDLVYSFDEVKNAIVIGRVGKIFVHENKDVGFIELSNNKHFYVTKEHRFYSPNTGTWKAIGEFKVGDAILDVSLEFASNSEPVVITNIDFAAAKDKTTVYNFHVEQYENYFVDGVLVHNIKNQEP